MSKYAEIRADYTDDKGVTHIDAWLTADDNENGTTIALIVGGDVYYKDYDAMTDDYAKEVIEEAKQEQNIGQDLIDKCIERIKEDVESGDLTAIDELLKFVPKQFLEGFLPENLD